MNLSYEAEVHHPVPREKIRCPVVNSPGLVSSELGWPPRDGKRRADDGASPHDCQMYRHLTNKADGGRGADEDSKRATCSCEPVTAALMTIAALFAALMVARGAQTTVTSRVTLGKRRVTGAPAAHPRPEHGCHTGIQVACMRSCPRSRVRSRLSPPKSATQFASGAACRNLNAPAPRNTQNATSPALSPTAVGLPHTQLALLYPLLQLASHIRN